MCQICKKGLRTIISKAFAFPFSICNDDAAALTVHFVIQRLTNANTLIVRFVEPSPVSISKRELHYGNHV